MSPELRTSTTHSGINKNRHAGIFSESVNAQVAYGEKYIDAALRRVNEELGLILEKDEHDASSGTRLTQVCKMNIDAKDEGYNYGFTGSIVSNSWRKNAFATIYECILDQDRIDHLSINPYEISNVYFLSLGKVLEFLTQVQASSYLALDLH